MKRLCCALLLVVILFLCSCTTDYDVDLSLLLEDINSQFEFENMITISDTAMLEEYYMIDAQDVQSFCAQCSSDSSVFCELVFVKAKDMDSAKRVLAILNNYYESRLTLVKSYSPEQLEMIQKCSVKQNGTYVSLIIDEQAVAIEELYNSYFEK